MNSADTNKNDQKRDKGFFIARFYLSYISLLIATLLVTAVVVFAVF
jgi:hypothetical protein